MNMIMKPTRREAKQMETANPVSKSLDEIQRLMHRKTTTVEESFKTEKTASVIRIAYGTDVFEITIEDTDDETVNEISLFISEMLLIEDEVAFEIAMQYANMADDVVNVIYSVRNQLKKEVIPEEQVPAVETELQEPIETKPAQPQTSKGETMNENTNTAPQQTLTAVEQFLAMARHCKTIENMDAVHKVYANAYPAAASELHQEKLKLQTYMIQKGYIQNPEKEKINLWQAGAIAASAVGAGLLIWKSLNK